MKEVEIIIPSNPKDQEAIAAVIDDIVLQMEKKKMIDDDIKEAKIALKENHDLNPSLINWMIKVRLNESFEAVSKERTQFEIAYETIFKK